MFSIAFPVSFCFDLFVCFFAFVYLYLFLMNSLSSSLWVRQLCLTETDVDDTETSLIIRGNDFSRYINLLVAGTHSFTIAKARMLAHLFGIIMSQKKRMHV